MSNILINDTTKKEVSELLTALSINNSSRTERSLRDYHLKNDEIITDAFVKLSRAALKDSELKANMAEIYKVAFPTGLDALKAGKVGLKLDMNGLREIAGFDVEVAVDKQSVRHEVIYDIRDNKVKSCVYEDEKMKSVNVLEGLHFVANEMRKKLPPVLIQTLKAKADVDNAVATHEVLLQHGLQSKSDYINAANSERYSKQLRKFLNNLDIDRYYEADTLRPVLDAVSRGKVFGQAEVVNTSTHHSEGEITALRGKVGNNLSITVTDNEIMLDKISAKYSIELSDLSKNKLSDALMLAGSRLEKSQSNDMSYSESQTMRM